LKITLIIEESPKDELKAEKQELIRLEKQQSEGKTEKI